MTLTDNQLHEQGYYLDPTDEIEVLKDTKCVDLFDQNGYHLTKAEQVFLSKNGFRPIERRHEDCMRYDWLVWDKKRRSSH